MNVENAKRKKWFYIFKHNFIILIMATLPYTAWPRMRNEGRKDGQTKYYVHGNLFENKLYVIIIWNKRDI